MAENFKKYKGGPTPISSNGHPNAKKTSGPPMARQNNKQFPDERKHPNSGAKHKHSPPVVPHHTTNPDWLYGGTHPLQIRPTLGPLAKPWAPLNHPMMTGQGGQNKPDGSRYAKGGEGVRPNPTNTARTSAGPQHPHMKVGMTKKIHGLIGKGKKKVHRSPY